MAFVLCSFLHFKSGAQAIQNPVGKISPLPLPGSNLVQISISISKPDLEVLRKYRWSQDDPNHKDRPNVYSTVTANGQVYTNVSLHQKGRFGSFQSIDRFPALTLNFSSSNKSQRFFGMSKISLNNSAQDPTCLHEKLARELYLAAGVPVPQADHAVVILNGRKLGLYVLTEGYDKEFLARHFKDSSGPLYDAGFLRDVDQTLDTNSGESARDPKIFQKLQAILGNRAETNLLAKLSKLIDMDRFLSMVAVEVLLCHWDSYSMNKNNYRIYHDPDSGNLVFMPHGMDQILGIDRRNLELPILPPMVGQVAQAVLASDEGRRAYLLRLDRIFRSFFDEKTLVARILEMDARIGAELPNPVERWPTQQTNPRAFVKTVGTHEGDIDLLRERLGRRIASVRRQLEKLQATAHKQGEN